MVYESKVSKDYFEREFLVAKVWLWRTQLY